MTIDLRQAQNFVASHARVIDQRRFEALLNDGDAPRAAIVNALGAYRSPDGGFGWGLEPDLRASESQPAAAMHALEALVGAAPSISPHTIDLFDWLDRATLGDGGLPFALPIADATACAPFWAEANSQTSSLQITAAVATQAHRVARHYDGLSSHPWLTRATRFCFDRIGEINERPFAYVLSFSLQLLNALAVEDSEACEHLEHLMRFVPTDGVLTVEGGAVGETVHLTADPGTPLHERLDPQAVNERIEHLANAQRSDGGWSVDFSSYSPAGALEWRGYTTVNAIATLRAHGRI